MEFFLIRQFKKTSVLKQNKVHFYNYIRIKNGQRYKVNFKFFC